MRRKDLEMPPAFAWEIVDACEWAALSTTTPQGDAYCVALSIAREDRTVYFHGAKRGRKSDCLRAHPEVCMLCVGETHRMSDMFTTEYASAVLRGEATLVMDDAQKIHALCLLSQRHTPANMHRFDAVVERSLEHTAVWKIDVREITGKRQKHGKKEE